MMFFLSLLSEVRKNILACIGNATWHYNSYTWQTVERHPPPHPQMLLFHASLAWFLLFLALNAQTVKDIYK